MRRETFFRAEARLTPSRTIARRAPLAGLALLVLALAAAPQSGKKSPPEKPLDLNKATAEELQQLPEVGPSLARAIVRFREKSGPFRRVEDLLAVRGMSRRRLDRIRPHVFVEQSEKSKPAAPANDAAISYPVRNSGRQPRETPLFPA
jgi:competence ComEA-like helix-hairpin-helix protein